MVFQQSRTNEALEAVIREVLAPLVQADGGVLYVLRADPRRVELHLAGRLSGCPGNLVMTQKVLEPAIHAVCPQAEVVVTWGMLIPEGARVVHAAP